MRVPSLWFITGLTGLVLLEIPPATGRFLEKFGADVFAGWLGQLVFLSLFLDGLRGILPKGVVLIPIMFYASYYFAYWEQGVHIRLKSDELRRMNPGKIIDFDPNAHSLVTDKADIFAATYSIPVVYSHESTFARDEYISYRLISRNEIRQYLSKDDSDVQVLSVYWNDVIQPDVKELRIAERPEHSVISVRIRDDPGEGWKDWNIGAQNTSLSLEGRAVGSFQTAYVRRLPIAPFFTIGCKYSTDSTKRTCQAEFVTERMSIESRPDSVDRAVYDDPVGIMLGIKPLSKEEKAHFHGFNGAASTRVPPGEDEAFEALRGVIDGRSPVLSWVTGVLVTGHSSRLAPLAAGMANRFLALNRIEDGLPGRREQAALLAAGIAALGPAEFADVQAELADLARKGGLRDEYPLLYLRLADAGPKLYSIYRDQFLAQNATQAERLLAALAICQIRQADSELIAAIKSEWTASDNGMARAGNYRAALFVALANLGHENVLRNSARSNSKVLQGWFDAVLAGRGKTDVGPNNCMPMEWPGNTYVPPFMAPRLRWTQQQWRVAD